MLRNSANSGLRCLMQRKDRLHRGEMLKQGERATVPAFEGQNLAAVAKRHDIALDGPCEGLGNPSHKRNSERWTEDLFGEGPKCTCCHIMVPNEFVSKLEPPLPGEIGILERLGDLYAPGTSRLACQISVSKELDGLTVFVPDGPPLDGS